MEKRLLDYLKKMEDFRGKKRSLLEQKRLLEDLLLQISFFQHERLIHLIVTVTFAILTMMAILCCLFLSVPSLFLLVFLLLVLLVPYIRHYYILENGVQRLYRDHDYFMEEYLKMQDDKKEVVSENKM